MDRASLQILKAAVKAQTGRTVAHFYFRGEYVIKVTTDNLLSYVVKEAYYNNKGELDMDMVLQAPVQRRIS